MRKLMTQLSIGEKIGIGFGLVGLLFLIVIWQYQSTLNRSLTDYKVLQNIEMPKKDQILAIETNFLRARLAEQAFRNGRDPQTAQAVYRHIGNALKNAEALSQPEQGPGPANAGGEIRGLLEDYGEHFKAVDAAWVSKGINENSGLQGSFREAAHDLQALAGNLNTDHIYLSLLQIRRAEKDLGLRRETQYQQRVYELIGRFEIQVRESELLPQVKQQLLSEMAGYKKEFTDYSRHVLEGGDLRQGIGPYRDAAHRVEDLINQYYVSDLERDVLQLRRREKDYLLRADAEYIDMTLNQLQLISDRIRSSKASDEYQKKFEALLNQYREDFLSLVEQNRKIDQLTGQMEIAAENVANLVKDKVQEANVAMNNTAQAITLKAEQRTDWMHLLIVLALALGVYFAIKITSHIVNSVRRMAAVLERLTFTEMVEAVPHVEGGRDEINEMAGYLNTLSEHRNRLVNWWKNSMTEADACRELQSVLEKLDYPGEESGEEALKAELLDALAVKKRLISNEFNEIDEQTEKILNASAMLRRPSVSRRDIDEHGKAIHHSAEMILKSINMLTFESKRTAQASA